MISVWLMLLIAIFCAYDYAKSVEPEMERPVITEIYQEEDSVTLKWTPVEYATSYSIHRRHPNSEWEFVKSVGSSQTSYTDEGAADGNYQYCVRSCNSGMGVMYWSGFSAAAQPELQN